MLLDKEQTAGIEVLTIVEKEGGMLFPVFGARLAMRVGTRVYAVKGGIDLKHLAGVDEQLGRVVLVLQIQLFVTIVILLFHGIEKDIPYFCVLTIVRIVEKCSHHHFRFGQITIVLNHVLG